MKRKPDTLDRLASYNWQAIRKAYDLWETIGDVDENPVRDDSRHIADTLLAEGHDLGAAHPTNRRRKVERWFEDRKRYSPYVDDIAVERALAGDWTVIDNLTALELRVFAEKVAAKRVEGVISPTGSDKWRGTAVGRRVEREVEIVRVAMENGIFTPILGDTGEEIETIEVVPDEEPLFVPEPETAPAEAEPVPA